MEATVSSSENPKPKTVKKKSKANYLRTEIINTTQVSQSLTLPEAISSDLAVYEYGKNSLKNKETYTVLQLGSRALNMTDLQITPFDICILDCVYSMIVDGVEDLTIEHLANSLMKREVKFKSTAELFKGAFEYMKLDAECFPHLSPEELDFYNFLHLTMHKLSEISIRLDCSHMKDKNGKRIFEHSVLYGALLPMEIGEYQSPVTKEQKVYYRFLKKSILYEYAEQLNRLATIPEKMLKTRLPASVDSVVLSREIAKTISLMKNRNNSYHTREIIYEWQRGNKDKGLFERIGLSKEDYPSAQKWSKVKARVHRDIGIILEDYKKQGIIADYAEIIQKRSKIGYQITL